MTQTLADSQKHLTSCDRLILCCYINITPQLQLIRIPNTPNLHSERVIFPGQRLMFKAVPEATLEIRTSENITLVVPCQNLRVTEILAKELEFTER